MMDTTLNEIRPYGPCEGRWKHLLQHLDPRPADDEPLPVARVLDVNGLETTLWVLSQMGERRLLVRFAADCAERVVRRYWEPLYPDDRRPQDAIEAARAWADDPTDENGERAYTAHAAAYRASHDAYADPLACTFDDFNAAQLAAYIAYAAATPDAVVGATAAAAAEAADAADDRAKERGWQRRQLRKYLEGDE